MTCHTVARPQDEDIALANRTSNRRRRRASQLG